MGSRPDQTRHHPAKRVTPDTAEHQPCNRDLRARPRGIDFTADTVSATPSGCGRVRTALPGSAGSYLNPAGFTIGLRPGLLTLAGPAAAGLLADMAIRPRHSLDALELAVGTP
jgi:hypothetical protein